VINLKTAKASGIELLPSLVALANEVARAAARLQSLSRHHLERRGAGNVGALAPGVMGTVGWSETAYRCSEAPLSFSTYQETTSRFRSDRA
jgi:hypothetical protein